ncbi:MAG TPA: threonine ammonia-lyase [Gaiellales bacterium]|nr:threonine ammonia-lyase [Gaiellales bacterium]
MVGLDDIRRARTVIDGVVASTPVLSAGAISRWAGMRVVLKAENLQHTGAFKLRGAVNRMSTLTDAERARGVVAASAGNHAQGVALAATALGVSSRVYMPVDAPLAKQVATADYGAEVVLAGETFEESAAAARNDPEGRVLVPPFDDPAIIAGQGTIGLELLEQVPEADTIVVPLGGGGLISGIAVAVKALRPDVRVIGVQASGCAAWNPSLAAGHPVVIERGTTIADGIAVQRPGDITFPLVQQFVDEVVEVTEDEICRAVVVLLERSKLMVEGAGAAGLAALLAGKVKAREAVCVLSGGNLDAGMLQIIVRFGLTRNGRFLRLRTQMPDRPGALKRLTDLFAENRVNILDIDYHRDGAIELGVNDVRVLISVETRDFEHGERVIEMISSAGYPAERL